MVSRFIFIFLLFAVSLFANNSLNSISVKNSSLILNFKKPITKKTLFTTVIPTKKITKYVFDFNNCTKSNRVKSLHKLSSTIKSIRISQYKPKVVRLVIDSYKKYSINYSQKNGTSNFVIKLPTKISSVKKNNDIKNMFTEIKTNNTIAKNPSKPILIKSVRLKKQYKILIDPGHGAHDSGAVGGKYKEKDIVLSIGKRVYKKLKTLGFNVYMTRYKDKFVKLSRRTQKANKMNADMFVSIHANSITNKRKRNIIHGIETYFLDKARTARAKRIAASENRSLLNSKDMATKNVLLNAVFIGPKVQLSNKLAIDIQKEVLGALKSRFSYVKDNGVRGAPFRVLVGAQMPAVLIETGYISNPKERKHLINSSYQDALASGIVKGIVNYFKNREKELE